MIARAARQLPQMPTPPSYNKVNPGDQPVIFLSLRSATLPLSTVNEYAETIGQRISMVSGVAQVQLFGAAKYAVRVDLDPRKLSARGIGIDEVASAIQNANVNLPTGTMYGPARAFTVLANGQLMRAPAYAPLVIAYRNGNPVRLNEVARVYDGIEQDKSANFYRGLRNINLSILKQPGTNVVAVVDSIKQLMPTFRESAAAVGARSTCAPIARRRSASRCTTSSMTLYLTFVLVVAVIFVFLRSVTATIIASLTLPVTMAATFAVMYLLNYSLDNLSLMALTLSIGFVVDNTIVMLENIVRHMEMGKSPMRASFDGSKEVAFTIVAMTASLVAIFIPVLFMGGLVGRLLQEFAVTIGVAIIVSGFLSISLTPMLCSRFLKPPHSQRHGMLYNMTERVFQAWVNAYDWTLQISLRYRAVTMAASLSFIAGSAYLFLIVPKGFLPSEDQDRFSISIEGMQGIGFEEMVRHQMEVADIVAKDPDIIGFSNNVGGGGGGGGGGQLNQGRMGIDLKPKSRADANGRSDHRRPSSAGGQGAGRARVHGQPAADQPRRPAGRAQRLPVHAAGHRHGGAVPLGAAPRGEDQGDPRRRGRQQRSAPEQPADPGRHRSRSRVVARPHRQPGRDRALQRLRHAPDLADLRARTTSTRDHGRRAGVPERSGRAVDALRARVERKADSAEHAWRR